MPPRCIQFGAFELDSAAGELRKHGIKIRLQEQPLQILQQLLERAGEVVTREELQKRIWPADTFVDFDHGLYSAVQRLRDALGDNAETPRYVETLPRRGYRFIAAVQHGNGVEAKAETARVEAPAPVVPERTVPRLSLRAPLLVAASAAVVVLLFALEFMGGSLRERLLGKPAVPAIRSLAVLPLQNLSSDPNQEYFAEGMTDALITDLSQISALRVVSRTSVMRYSKTDESAPQVARELNVDAIIEGTVQRSGDRVRITAQLIYGPSDRHIWAKSFERDVKDMLALQGAVASEIANEVQVKVKPVEQAKLKSFRPVNPKALDAYVEARFHLDQAAKFEFYNGKQESLEEEVRKAVSYLDRAVQEDPSYTPVYAAYFDVIDAENISRLEYLPQAEAALRKALELDESNVSAHLALARLLIQFEYDWPGAERECKRAIELNPNSADARYRYSEYLANVGRNTEGDKERDLAQALDPSHDYFGDAGVHRIGNTIDQDRQTLEERATNDPFALAVQGKNYAIAGRYKESVEMWERSLALYGWLNFASVLKRAEAKGGPKFALEEWMLAGEEYSKTHNDWPAVAMAFTYSSLGNNDRAFAWLDRAVAQRSWCIIYLRRDDVWNPLRKDPRFADLLRRVGLSE
jgi:TolB-like protein/DNA-binding winged helix-turn-helix (wHTH) protein